MAHGPQLNADLVLPHTKPTVTAAAPSIVSGRDSRQSTGSTNRESGTGSTTKHRPSGNGHDKSLRWGLRVKRLEEQGSK
jgi:hypothetical protein